MTRRQLSLKNSSQAGFTIVELMIATLVFSTVILVITFGIMQFSRAYYRGTTTTSLQNTTRSVIDSVSQAIQFSGSDVTSWATGNSGGYCIGGIEFQYTKFAIRTATNHVLASMPSTAGGSCIRQPYDSTNVDLAGQNIRVVNFTVSSVTGNLYKVDVRLVYGADDLLCSPSNNDCSSKTTSTHLNASDLTCKIANGSQFCAASELSTIVQKRVQ